MFFCVNVIATVLKGNIAAGVQLSEPDEGGLFRASSDINDSGRIDLIPMINLPASTRWVSALGISSWFPRKYRKAVPAVSIVVVGIFVNAVALLSGTVGLFTQLGMGFGYLLNPDFQPNSAPCEGCFLVLWSSHSVFYIIFLFSRSLLLYSKVY